MFYHWCQENASLLEGGLSLHKARLDTEVMGALPLNAIGALVTSETTGGKKFFL